MGGVLAKKKKDKDSQKQNKRRVARETEFSQFCLDQRNSPTKDTDFFTDRFFVCLD